ncbi:MAG: ribosomal-processing cysteine protease Prp [Lachnospiraceae bacterium]|nr:ribosomal-processing cysteine protease Prp [Lachnospiraceae bacterium]
MIKISFKYDHNNDPVGFICTGHAGFAAFGKDIICAAVSALVINCVNSVSHFTTSEFDLESDEKKGYIKMVLEDEPSSDSILLLKSLELGLNAIINDEGSKFVKLVDWNQMHD